MEISASQRERRPGLASATAGRTTDADIQAEVSGRSVLEEPGDANRGRRLCSRF
jgi:hypothetical protein